MRAVAGMVVTAVAIGLLLGGAAALLLFVLADWFDPIARWVHEYGFLPWGREAP
nr:hypothetical protein KitaXyl93_67550 [Kitasatospora sp. Xyl93]